MEIHRGGGGGLIMISEVHVRLTLPFEWQAPSVPGSVLLPLLAEELLQSARLLQLFELLGQLNSPLCGYVEQGMKTV